MIKTAGRLAVVVAILVAAFGIGSVAPLNPVECVPDVETREKIRALMLEAIDQAFKEHIVRLHQTWMRDETGQPARAVTGAHQGIHAYMGGRASAMTWDPPLC